METHVKSMVELAVTNAQEFPETPFLMFYDEIVTYKDLDERSNAFANYLLENGVTKGDVVSFMLGNNPDFFYCLIGIQKVGAIAGPVSCWLQAPEVDFLVNDSKPKVIVIDPEYAGIVSAISRTIPSVKKIVVNSLTEMELDFQYDNLPAILDETSKNLPAGLVLESDDIAGLMYTSGTTGTPKAVALTHKNILSAAHAATNSIPIAHGLRILLVLPLFTTGGLYATAIPCMYRGATIVLRRNFSATEYWESVERYKVNAFLIVPTIWNILLNTPEADTVDTSSLRFGMSGASPIPPEQLRACEKRFNIPILEAYGQTENSGIVTTNRLDKRKTGSIGFAFEGIEASIFNKDGREAPTGEIGEIVTKGDTVMKGYYNNPEATASTIKDGWLYTGDLGYRDDDGFFYIVDRQKDMIIRGGVNVYPKEIENTIATHPKVSGVAVIAEPHEKYGQVPKACMVLQRGESLTEDEIRLFCQERMAEYKIPEVFLFRESLPTNALGKVIKKDLFVELQEEETAIPVPVKHFFEEMPGRFLPDNAKEVDATVSYNITGKGGGKWTLTIKDQIMTLTEGILKNPTVYVVAKDADYFDIATGKIDGITAVMTGKLKIEGDVNFMAQLRDMLRPVSY